MTVRAATLLVERERRIRGELERSLEERNELERELVRAGKLGAMGELLAGVAHEIRNPLGSIRLYVQLLSDDQNATVEQGKVCRKIDRAITGLDAIVRDVLLFARESSLRVEEVHLETLMASVISNCEGLLGHHNIMLRQAIEDGTVVADGGLMVQAVSNVLRNAVEASTAMESEAERKKDRAQTLGAV